LSYDVLYSYTTTTAYGELYVSSYDDDSDTVINSVYLSGRASLDANYETDNVLYSHATTTGYATLINSAYDVGNGFDITYAPITARA